MSTSSARWGCLPDRKMRILPRIFLLLFGLATSLDAAAARAGGYDSRIMRRLSCWAIWLDQTPNSRRGSGAMPCLADATQRLSCAFLASHLGRAPLGKSSTE